MWENSLLSKKEYLILFLRETFMLSMNGNSVISHLHMENPVPFFNSIEILSIDPIHISSYLFIETLCCLLEPNPVRFWSFKTNRNQGLNIIDVTLIWLVTAPYESEWIPMIKVWMVSLLTGPIRNTLKRIRLNSCGLDLVWIEMNGTRNWLKGWNISTNRGHATPFAQCSTRYMMIIHVTLLLTICESIF